MKTVKTLSALGIILLGVLAVSSCKKDEQTAAVSNTEAASVAQEDATSGDVYDDVYTESEDVVSSLEQNKYAVSTAKSAELTGSRTITVSKGDTASTTFPKTITITYTNWQGKSGRVKNGTIVITVSAPMRKVGAVRSITFQDFTINDTLKVEGTKTVTNKGLVNGKPTVEVKLEDGKVTNLSTGEFVSRNFVRTRTWEAGYDTPLYIWDDVYTISGSASGVNRKGFAYTSTILTPLEIKVGCPWIRKGVIEIKIENSKTVTIDYGNGTCDKKYTVTVDGQTKEMNSLSGNEAI